MKKDKIPSVARQLADWSYGFLQSAIEHAECSPFDDLFTDEVYSDTVGLRPQDDSDLENPTEDQWNTAWEEAIRCHKEEWTKS